MSAPATRVLVVDDSALVRQTLLGLLTQHGGFDVAVAADPIIARRRIAHARPHVIVLDLEMPHMDGLTFLRQLMAEDPLPVVVCSALAPRAGRAAMDALAAGAVDVITKPVVGVRGFLEEQIVSIVDALRAAAGARLARRGSSAPDPVRPSSAPRAGARPAPARPRVVAIGASTGGTQAIRSILTALPADGPAMLVTQHMPEGFTRAFADRLDQDCDLEVREARDGDRVRPGRVLLAPGDRHLRLRVDAAGYFGEVSVGPLVSRHRPSVDVLFGSVAEAAGDAAVGVLLTGMGDDGAAGLLAMRRAGAPTVAQDESTCVVFGMPREAIRRGAAARVLPLHEIADAIRALAAAPTGGPAAQPDGPSAARSPAGDPGGAGG